MASGTSTMGGDIARKSQSHHLFDSTFRQTLIHEIDKDLEQVYSKQAEGVAVDHILRVLYERRDLLMTEQERYYEWILEKLAKDNILIGDPSINCNLLRHEFRYAAFKQEQYDNAIENELSPPRARCIPRFYNATTSSGSSPDRSSTSDNSSGEYRRVQWASSLTSSNDSFSSPATTQPRTETGTGTGTEGSSPRELVLSFRPSRYLMGQPRNIDPRALLRGYQAGLLVNSNYQGELTQRGIENQLAPAYENCALHIEGIPALATTKEIFEVFQEGKIFQFSKNEPVPGVHRDCAARVAFMNRDAAQKFLDRAESLQGIQLHNQRLRVIWNRNQSRPIPEAQSHQSRVLRIVGPCNDLSAHRVEAMLHGEMVFTLVDSTQHFMPCGKCVVLLSFASILGQSRMAMNFLQRDFLRRNLQDRCSISYARDPCDRSECDFAAKTSVVRSAPTWRSLQDERPLLRLI